MSITKPPYPAEFRQQMVELVQTGCSASELAREFGPHVTSILNWVRKAGLSVPAGSCAGAATERGRTPGTH